MGHDKTFFTTVNTSSLLYLSCTQLLANEVLDWVNEPQHKS